jgi:purine catabolism regulator
MAVMDAPTLRALLARRDLHLTPAIAEEHLSEGAWDAPIRWVHNSDLTDPTPFLSDGLVLLTTGTQMAAWQRRSFEDYVHRLSVRGVVALGFGTEVVRDGIPPLLVSACRDVQMPLFEVPYRTPFIAVARANAEAIAAETFARRSWALSAQRAISLAALRPNGLTATLAELARQLETWVGLFDPAGSLVNEHPAGSLDAVTRAGLDEEVGRVLRRGARAGSSLHIGDTPFTLQTLGRGGHLRGVIAIAAGALDQEGRGVVTAVIAMAGLALEQNEGLQRARALLRTGVLQSLLSDDPTLADRIAAQMWGGMPPEPALVAVTDAPALSDAATEWLELRVDETPGTLFFARTDEGVVLVVPADRDAVLDDLAETFGAKVGVSSETGYDQFSRALGQARVARTRGGAFSIGAVTRFADVAASGILSALGNDAGRSLARAAIEPLRRNDEEEGTALVETLHTWLEQDARYDAAAEVLGVHRHTVRARVALAQRLLGVDLGTFPARAELWAALQVDTPPPE